MLDSLEATLAPYRQLLAALGAAWGMGSCSDPDVEENEALQHLLEVA